jgi:hypothetical protein
LQYVHQVAQNSMRRTFPLSPSLVTLSPSRVLATKCGPDSPRRMAAGLAVAASERTHVFIAVRREMAERSIALKLNGIATGIQ